MNKYSLILFFCCLLGNVSAQTLLNQFPIELKKPSSHSQIFNTHNSKNEYFTFVSDKEKCTVLKYNAALFFKDSLSVNRPEKDFEFMSGVTFSANESPNLYWTSKDFEKIQLVNFDLEKHSSSRLIYENDFSKEKVVDVFTAANAFHILTITSENKLKFTRFSNTGKEEFIVDLDNKDPEKNTKTNADLVPSILDLGIVIIDNQTFIPLQQATAKVKRYLNNGEYLLTFDKNNATTVCRIILSDFSLQKEQFIYEKLDKNSGSNSFLHQNILYQLTANSEKMVLTATDLPSKNTINTYTANAKEEISFKNSPIFLHTDSKPRILKKTAQMLSKINVNNLGISVYTAPNYNLFTIGGVRDVASGGNLLLGIGLSVGGAIVGTSVDMMDVIETTHLQSIYFESLFDHNFNHIKKPFLPLYADALGEFMDENNFSVQNIYRYKNFMILNYYDPKSKEIVMRKFEDFKE
ncbi:hypothetical protein [Flavobacterium sp.]|uniref:hypothetical protein n=1 Tax=Flavobacterium sp. TaxID=239 RepID=UPI002634F21A|nr:hypothetical protein [Flavobacterium sp.]MDD3003768.1 hypothetical protein [Flavobacterium sp.]